MEAEKQQDVQQDTSAYSALDQEFVPLAVASSVAYFHLTDAAKQVDSQEHLADMLRIVALALSQVAPIHRAPAAERSAPLSEQQIEEFFFRPLNEGGEGPSLDGFCIRRGDLRRALVTLREARTVFGRRNEP